MYKVHLSHNEYSAHHTRMVSIPVQFNQVTSFTLWMLSPFKVMNVPFPAIDMVFQLGRALFNSYRVPIARKNHLLELFRLHYSNPDLGLKLSQPRWGISYRSDVDARALLGCMGSITSPISIEINVKRGNHLEILWMSFKKKIKYVAWDCKMTIQLQLEVLLLRRHRRHYIGVSHPQANLT